MDFEEAFDEVLSQSKERFLNIDVNYRLDRFLGEDKDIDETARANLVKIARAVTEGAVIDEEVIEFVIGNVEFSFLLPAFLTTFGLPPSKIPKWSATITDDRSNKRAIAAYQYAQSRMREYTRQFPEVRWKWLQAALEEFKLEKLRDNNHLNVIIAMSLPTMIQDAKTQFGGRKYTPYLEALALSFELNYEGVFGIETHYGRTKPSRLVINNTVFESGRLFPHNRSIEPLAAVLASPVPVKSGTTSSVPLILTDEFWEVVGALSLPITEEIREIEWPRYFYI